MQTQKYVILKKHVYTKYTHRCIGASMQTSAGTQPSHTFITYTHHASMRNLRKYLLTLQKYTNIYIYIHMLMHAYMEATHACTHCILAGLLYTNACIHAHVNARMHPYMHACNTHNHT